MYCFSVATLALSASFFLFQVSRPRDVRWRAAIMFTGTACIFAVALWLDCALRGAVSISIGALLGYSTSRAGREHSTSGLDGIRSFRIYAAALMAVSALVWIHLPVMAFLSSPGELVLDLKFLLKNNLQGALMTFYVGLLVYAVSRNSRARLFLGMAATLVCVVSIAYAFILPLGYPHLSGFQFENPTLRPQQLVARLAADLLVLAILSTVVVKWFTRWSTRGLFTALVILNLGLTTVTAFSVLRAESPTVASERGSSQRSEVRLSSDGQNVLLLVLDRFMGGFVETAVEASPTLADDFDGFIWVPKSVSAGQNSIAGLPPLLGGYDYTPTAMNARSLPLKQQTNEAFSILPWNFSRAGWESNLLRPHGLDFMVKGNCSALSVPRLACGDADPELAVRAARELGIPVTELGLSDYTDLLALLATLRVAPYGVKDVLIKRAAWRPFVGQAAAATLTEWANLAALDEISSVRRGPNQLNIVFNFLSHEPYFIDEACRPTTQKTSAPPESLMSDFEYQHVVGDRCVLNLVVKYIEWLKANGVYDNTLIVLASDHGIANEVTDHSTRAVAGGTQDNLFVASRSLLLYKPINARGPLRTSEAFIPNAGVPELICQTIGGCTNPYLDERTIEAHGRDDPFTVSFVPWQFTAQEPNRFVIERSYVLRGRDPYNATAWSAH